MQLQSLFQERTNSILSSKIPYYWMCGIAGIFNRRGSCPVDLEIIQSMLSRIQYRGPDESGIYLGRNIGLGNVRLSIIDLQTGQQPISSESKNLWIVFNGEIFNYIELRKELTQKGYVFHTSSDTEVVVNLFEEYGTDCFAKMNGQFAVAIWNKKKQELVLARDRVGIRPLFYAFHQDILIFGSEIKAILEFPEISPEISSKSLTQIFTFWTTLSPNTIFKDIYELTPGSYMVVDSRKVRIESFWKLSFPNAGMERSITLNKAMEEFHSLFLDAVKIRLRADVPVGAYLSGGIDSSITTAYIQSIFPKRLRTYSIGFTESEFDESNYQKMAVDFLQTGHASITCNSKEIADKFPDVIWHTEMPLLRTAPAPMFFLSKLVRDNNFKVVVTGEGADEMLAGYNIFKEMMVRRFWAKDPQSKLRPLLLQKLYPYLPQMQDTKSTMLKFFFGYKLEDTAAPVYSHLLRWNNTARIKNHFSESIRNSIGDYDPLLELDKMLPDDFSEKDHLAKAQWLETTIFMSGYLLSSQGDRMAMANSVEGRYPFLDHRVIEFCNNLPPDFKLNGLTEKYLLKKLMKRKLPDPIIDRPKQAYRAPVASCFITNTPEYLPEILSKKELINTGIFNPLSVNQLVSNMRRAKQISETDSMALTGIISVQLLYGQFIQKNYRAPVELNLRRCKLISDITN